MPSLQGVNHVQTNLLYITCTTGVSSSCKHNGYINTPLNGTGKWSLPTNLFGKIQELDHGIQAACRCSRMHYSQPQGRPPARAWTWARRREDLRACSFAPTELVTWWLSNPTILVFTTLKSTLNMSPCSVLPLQTGSSSGRLLRGWEPSSPATEPQRWAPLDGRVTSQSPPTPRTPCIVGRSCNPMLIGDISNVFLVKFSPVITIEAIPLFMVLRFMYRCICI